MTASAKTWAPIATFVAVAAVGTTIALVSTGDGGPKSLKPLGLTAGAGGAADAARSAAGGSSSEYTVTGTLSDAEPADAAVWNLAKGPADKALVSRLADALKAGTPVREGDGWRAGGLVVTGEAGRSWYFSPCGVGKDSAISSDGSTRSACGVATAPEATVGAGASGSGGSSDVAVSPPVTNEQPSPAPEPPPVEESVVKDAAGPVLEALGYSLADADIDTYPYGGSAVVDVEVDGLEVYGFTTRVDVDRSGAVSSANGFLAEPSKGDAYPLMSAKDAFEGLPPMARPDICQLPPDGSSGCVEPEPVEITGADLGLSWQQTRDGSALVPSWLYRVKGSDYPLVAIAVEKQYQSAPDEKPVDDPGVIEPGTPDSVPPSAPRSAIGVQAAKAGPGSTLLVTYENGGCGQKNVTGMAKEDDKSVYVVLEADTPPADQMCTADSRPATISVDLQAPLGTRTVIDGSTSKPVPSSS